MQTSRREVLAQVVAGNEKEGITIRYETRPAEGNILHQQTVVHPYYHRPTMPNDRPKPGSWHYAVDPVDGYVCPCARPYADKGYRRVKEIGFHNVRPDGMVEIARVELADEKFGDVTRNLPRVVFPELPEAD